MKLEEARGIAARIWCEPKHSEKTMDPDFAESIAVQLIAAYAEGQKAGFELGRALLKP